MRVIFKGGNTRGKNRQVIRQSETPKARREEGYEGYTSGNARGQDRIGQDRIGQDKIGHRTGQDT